MDNITLKKIIGDAQYAIEHIDQPAAFKLLEKVNNFSHTPEILKDDIARQKLQEVELNLKIVAFPSLSDEESVVILRDHILNFFNIDIPLESQITAKLFIVPYFIRDDLREKLKRALLENNQVLGNFSVKQWIQKFEDMFKNKKTIKSPIEFLMHHQDAVRLNSADRKKIKDILHIYNYLLTATLPATDIDLDQIVSYVKETGDYDIFTDQEISAVKKYPNNDTYFSDSVAFLEIPIVQAIQKYPAIGEQVITNTPIQIKSSSNPVRPSIKNWIYDYRHVKGNDVYEDLERGNYLFHGKNTSKLTLPERQRLSLVLKSLDNNVPLPIDIQRQQIAFSQIKMDSGQKINNVGKQPIKSNWNEMRVGQERGMSRVKPEMSKDFPREHKAAARQQLGSVGDFHFSSPQKFESERSSDNSKHMDKAKAAPPPKTASNDLDYVHATLKEEKKLKEDEKIKSHMYQIYPIGDSVSADKNNPLSKDGAKENSKARRNVVDLKRDL